MANNSPTTGQAGDAPKRIFSRGRFTVLLTLLAFLAACLVFSWITRDALVQLPFLRAQGKSKPVSDSRKTIVDLHPWQTAQSLSPLAVSAEELEYAREAERLADHEVDQAFAAALRQANAQKRTLTGDALTLSQRIAQLQQTVKDDQAQVKSLTPASPPASSGDGNAAPVSDELQIAQAQLGLDSDELADAEQDLARETGDQRVRIQQELTAHEAAMKKYDVDSHAHGQIAVLSAAQYGTLAGRIRAWFNQRNRYQLIREAMQQAETDASALTQQHNSLAAQANGGAVSGGAAVQPANVAPNDNAGRLANLKSRSAQRQLLGIYDDRIQTQQQLAAVYDKWSAQVELQHRILLHLILQSLAWIALIIIFVILGDALVRRVMERPSLDRRRRQTLRVIFDSGIQIVGLALVLMVIFGVPSQMPTILGLATAGLTVVLQDFILAFFGWFILMGKNGIRVGDWVEINGVGGEVIEISLFRTALLETGNWTDKGHPTGRRVTFINNFAVNGQYFNFSTNGQWMWDEISVSIPASGDTYAKVELIHKAVLEETEKDTQLAEQEWKFASGKDGLSQFSATPAVNLRPAASGVDILVRYVTRASERFDVRNRIYQRMIDVLDKDKGADLPAAAASVQA